MLTAKELEFLISRDIGPDWVFVYSYRAFEGDTRVILYNEATKDDLRVTITGMESGNPRLVAMPS